MGPLECRSAAVGGSLPSGWTSRPGEAPAQEERWDLASGRERADTHPGMQNGNTPLQGGLSKPLAGDPFLEGDDAGVPPSL